MYFITVKFNPAKWIVYNSFVKSLRFNIFEIENIETQVILNLGQKQLRS